MPETSLVETVRCPACAETFAVPLLGDAAAVCSHCGHQFSAPIVPASDALAVVTPTAVRTTRRTKSPKPKNPAVKFKKSRSYSERTVRALFLRSRGVCAVCRKELVTAALTADAEPSNTAIIAHIVAHSAGGPRGDNSMTTGQRRQYSNLLVVCADCSRTIDDQPSHYTVDRLFAIKAEHEIWGMKQVKAAVTHVNFPELEVIVGQLVSTAAPPTSVFSSLAIQKKIRRNKLSAESANMITIGLSRIREVEKFVQARARHDVTFPERLKAGFVGEYQRFMAMGIRGDSLFDVLASFSAGGHLANPRRQAAGLMILTYLFDRCEVFES